MILQAREMGLMTRCCGLTLAECQASMKVTYFQSKAAGKTLVFSALPFWEGRGVKMNFWKFFNCAAVRRKKPNITKPAKRKAECSWFFAAVASAICVSNVWPHHKTVLSSSLAFSHFTCMAFTMPLFRVLCFRETSPINFSSWSPMCLTADIPVCFYGVNIKINVKD